MDDREVFLAERFLFFAIEPKVSPVAISSVVWCVPAVAA